MWKEVESSGCGLIWDAVSASPWKHLGKARKLRMVDVPAESKISEFPHTSHRNYHLSQGTC
jgi:hypothetical protein